MTTASSPPRTPKPPAGPKPKPSPSPKPTKPKSLGGVEVMLPVAEVAALWRCSRQHVYNLIATRQLDAVQLGDGRAKTRVPESALAAFLARRLTKARAA